MATATSTKKVFDPEVQLLVAELTAEFNLNGGRLPGSVEDFWQAIGAAIQMAVPRTTALAMAKVVLERLGEEWDPDFDDEGSPSLLAYEALAERVRGRKEGASESEDEDEDDDATGELARQAQIIVVGQDAPISTITEWIRDRTLVLDPDWQRGYVWKGSRKRRFIESIFLNLPIPPVLLFQDKDGKLYVIDGRQRLETVYRYSLGNSDKKRSFTTFSSKTPGWKEGDPLNDAAGKRYDKLPPEFQNRFKTFIIPGRVFHNLPRRKLYEVFKRYNTGGDKLKPAEIRNAVYQGNKLHEMIYRLAGEHKEDRFKDQAERDAAAMLRKMMRNKTARYGAYNFIGRYLAFAYMRNGSVAAATNEFMDTHGEADPEPFRQDFLETFHKTVAWYEYPLAAALPTGKAPFHEWVATIQMVSTRTMLGHIKAGRTTEEKVKSAVAESWTTFVGGTFDEKSGEFIGGVLQDKQNTSTHWGRQRVWIDELEEHCNIPTEQRRKTLEDDEANPPSDVAHATA